MKNDSRASRSPPAPPARRRAQTSVSIGINQPGVYGRINIGDVPPPAL